MRAKAVRENYIGKEFPKGNVAVGEVLLPDGEELYEEGTSRERSPTPQPQPKSKGGMFEPSVDSHSERVMDTDAECKVLSAIAAVLLEESDPAEVEAKLYLYTERKPCQSCEDVLRQFKDLFPKIEIGVFWDYPYP